MEPVSTGFDRQHRPQKTARIFVDGIGEDLCHRTLLNHLACIHDRDRVRYLSYEGEVMAYEDHSEAELLLELVQEVDHLLLHGHVKGGGWLICDDDLRIAGKRHGDEHALTLSSRELVG